MIKKGFLTVEENKELKYIRINFKGYEKYILFADEKLEYSFGILDKINNKLILFKYPTPLYNHMTPTHEIDLMLYQVKMVEETLVKQKQVLSVPRHGTNYSAYIEILNKMLF